MNIALVSLDQVWEDKIANLKQCDSYIKKSSENGVDLIIFPEMTLTGFSMNATLIGEQEECSNTVDEFKKLAKKYCIAIVFGVVFHGQNRDTNNLIFITKNGRLGSKYAKIHPFSYSGEDKVYKGGNEISTQSFMDADIGLTICYDLRFPELYSALGVTCDMVINISNWPKKRINHWKTLLKARAIENQYFCIGVNRTGVDGNGLKYEDSSVIYNANGELLEPRNIGNKISVFSVDKNWTKSFKKTFKTTQDRRLSLYSKFYK
jgi:omega-amidase